MDEIPKVLFDEVMEEVEEECTESLGEFLSETKLDELIKGIQQAIETDVKSTIEENYSEGMGEVKKMILGEKLSRVVTKQAKVHIQKLLGDIMERCFDLVDELRNEVIEEAFEET